jgi:phosphotriesterase-related protein
MRRREFLLSLAFAPVPDSALVHEHILVDFIGAGIIGPGRYNPNEVFPIAKAKLDELKPFGCRRLQECTPSYLGRNSRLLARLQDATGIELWTNTGLYGAANHKYLPAFAQTETAGQLAHRWIAEAKSGIDGIKPRFIKTGVNNAPLDPIDRKLIEAAAVASNETGLVICSHTGGRGPAALEQLEILAANKCPASKFVWVHAQNEKDHAFHAQVARAGAWVEFDGINTKSADWHLDCVQFMQSKELLHRTLISQDSGWYRVGEPGGGQYNGYAYIYTDFLPRLTAATTLSLMVKNPVACFGK